MLVFGECVGRGCCDSAVYGRWLARQGGSCAAIYLSFLLSLAAQGPPPCNWRSFRVLAYPKAFVPGDRSSVRGPQARTPRYSCESTSSRDLGWGIDCWIAGTGLMGCLSAVCDRWFARQGAFAAAVYLSFVLSSAAAIAPPSTGGALGLPLKTRR